MIYNTIKENLKSSKQLALLIDPENYTEETLTETLKIADEASFDFFLVGGSLISKPIDDTIQFIKNNTAKPVILFPGSLMQLSDKADGILFLTLISGRNPELLIGNQVLAAPFLKKSGIEVIPTGYLLIDEGNKSSVEYISNTRPIPQNKVDLITATATAGELLGLKMIYLEAGSGASSSIQPSVIKAVKSSIKIPLIIGGGIRSANTVKELFTAGADIIVVGNAVENHPETILEIAKAK